VVSLLLVIAWLVAAQFTSFLNFVYQRWHNVAV
jgi:hypothetical protein